MTRITKTSLLDQAETSPLPAGVVSRKALPRGGYQYIFKERVLPSWVVNAANEHDFVLVDNDPTGKFPGRCVSLERPPKKFRRDFYDN